MLEERKNGSKNPLAQFVWHRYYIDGRAVRYFNANTDGDLVEKNDGRHYYVHVANFNVPTVDDGSATVLERNDYTVYSEVAVLDPNFSAAADGLGDIGNEHLYTGRRAAIALVALFMTSI